MADPNAGMLRAPRLHLKVTVKFVAVLLAPALNHRQDSCKLEDADTKTRASRGIIERMWSLAVAIANSSSDSDRVVRRSGSRRTEMMTVTGLPSLE